MGRIITFFSTCLIVIHLTACEQKPLYPKNKSAKKSQEKGSISSKSKQATAPKTSDIGVSDVADYATGLTPLKTKQHSKNKLTKTYNDRNNNLDKAIKE